MELRIGEEQLINVLSLALIQTDPKGEIPFRDHKSSISRSLGH